MFVDSTLVISFNITCLFFCNVNNYGDCRILKNNNVSVVNESNGNNFNGTVVILLLLLPTTWYFYWRITNWPMIKLANKIPGPKGYPLIGNLFDFMSLKQTCVFHKLFEDSLRYSPVVKAWLGPKLLIFLTDPRDVELVLSSHTNINKSRDFIKFLKPWFGGGLSLSTGDKWKLHRQLIAPAFDLKVINSFIDLFNIKSKKIVRKMKTNIIGRKFDCCDYMAEATIESLLETSMGITREERENLQISTTDYACQIRKMCEAIHRRYSKFWLQSDVIFNLSGIGRKQKALLAKIHNFSRKIMANKNSISTSNVHNSTIKNKSQKNLNFLDSMFEASLKGLVSGKVIKQQVDTILFEGSANIITISSFFLSLMGIHLEIQEKVYRELNCIFEKSDRKVTLADTLKMEYLERCLLETLRLYPPVPIMARRITKNVALVSGKYTLPAGATIIIGTFKIHRSEEFYPNPEIFNPDNFLLDRISKRHKFSFIPFSAGPRNCIGKKYAMLQMKILLSTILRAYKFKSDVLKEKDFNLQVNIILNRAGDFPVEIEPRKLTEKVD